MPGQEQYEVIYAQMDVWCGFTLKERKEMQRPDKCWEWNHFEWKQSGYQERQIKMVFDMSKTEHVRR